MRKSSTNQVLYFTIPETIDNSTFVLEFCMVLFWALQLFDYFENKETFSKRLCAGEQDCIADFDQVL